MLLTNPRGNYIERVLRDSSGRLARVSMCVYEDNGRIKARILNVIYLEEAHSLKNTTLTLGGNKSSKTKRTYLRQDTKFVSPYFSYNNLLFFFGSIPRAPTK